MAELRELLEALAGLDARVEVRVRIDARCAWHLHGRASRTSNLRMRLPLRLP